MTNAGTIPNRTAASVRKKMAIRAVAAASYISPTPKFLTLSFLMAVPAMNIVAAIRNARVIVTKARGAQASHVPATAWFTWLQYHGASTLAVPSAAHWVVPCAQLVPARSARRAAKA